LGWTTFDKQYHHCGLRLHFDKCRVKADGQQDSYHHGTVLPAIPSGGSGARADAWGVQEKWASPLHDADDSAGPWPQLKHGPHAIQGIPDARCP